MSRKAALSGGAKHPRGVPPPRTRGAHRAEATGSAKPGRQAWLLAPALVLAVLTAYYPAWHGGPVWDDEGHLTRAELRSVEGLRRIWFEPGATQQYYPVVHSAFWIQHRIWGDDTLGYHLVSIALQSLSALLVAAILRRLAVPGAWLAAVIFALHPVHVESVAWISELKNTLSGVFYLACALVYLQFDESRQPRQYALALVFFILALLSKTVAATLPAALLVVLWWRRGALVARRDVRPLVPFFVLGAAAGLLTTWVERTLIGASGPEFDLTPLERGLIAGRAIPFYLWKLLWPFELVFNYPRWAVDARAWPQYVFPAGVLALLVVLAAWRTRMRAILTALLLFCGALVPVLGFLNVFPFRYSFVADHFQYLASIPILALVSAGLTRLAGRRAVSVPVVNALLTLVLAAPLAALTWRQSRDYASAETLYRATLSRNPSSWMAHNNLGRLLVDDGRSDEALVHFREAVRLNRDRPEHHANLGLWRLRYGPIEEAEPHLQEALRLRPDYAEAHNSLGFLRLRQARLDDALAHFQEAVRLQPALAEARENLCTTLERLGRPDESLAACMVALRMKPGSVDARYSLAVALRELGRLDDALVQLTQVLGLRPGHADAHYQLGLTLYRLGRFEDAVARYQEAVRLRPDLAIAHNDLGAALQQLGRVEEALARFRHAVRLQPDYPDAHFNLANMLQRTGRLSEAVVHYQEALRQKGGDAATHNNLGAALEAVGRLREAVAHYGEAMRLDPESQQARDNLTRARARLDGRRAR